MKTEKYSKTATKKENGYTLIEILMAILLFSIIGAIMGGSFIAGTQIRKEQDDVVEMQQNIRVAFHILSRDLRMAGYEITANWDPSALRTANIISGDNQTINFSYIVNDNQIDANGDDKPDTGQLANLSYSINDKNLIRNDGTKLIPVATNINAICFAYLNNAGVWSATPPTVPSDTRAVGITVIAQSRRIDRKRPAVARTFTDPFLPPPKVVIYTSPADQFRRSIASTVINLRNFGI